MVIFMHPCGDFYGSVTLKVTIKKRIETGFLGGDVIAIIMFNTAVIAPESPQWLQ